MLISPKTKANLDNYLSSPFHALLIAGPEGSGKQFALEYVASKLVSSSLDKYPYATVVEGAQEGIDKIREIKKEFSYKFVSANSDDYRIVVIKSIDRISHESHAALLKLVEEPPTKTIIFMTAVDLSSLPATILSRTKLIEVLPIDQKTTADYLLSHGLSQAQAEQAWLRTNGLARNITELAEGTTKSEEALDLAKRFASSKAYSRLATINELAKLDKSTQKAVLKFLSDIVYFKLSKTLSADSIGYKKLASALEKTNTSQLLIEANVNPKLIWLELSLYL